jgi:uncharacterized protein GlcG (DUF336 family)
MRLWRHSSDRELERRLRDARPEPDEALTKSLTDRVRPRRSPVGSLARAPLGLAGALSIVVLAPVVALGGADYPIRAASAALNLDDARQARPAAAPAADQYGVRVTICLANANGGVQLRVRLNAAQVLVRIGRATMGPCGGAGAVNGATLRGARSTLQAAGSSATGAVALPMRIVKVHPQGGPRAESVMIRNIGPFTVDLRGYALRDADHLLPSLKFRTTALASGRVLRVITGCHNKSDKPLRVRSRYYACRTKQMWNDTAGTVKLLDDLGAQLALKKYDMQKGP